MKAVMKAKKVSTAKVMTKGGLTGELANSTELKKADISTILNTLAEIGTKEVKKSGKFVLPGLVMIKARNKPAKKAGKKVMFGKYFWSYHVKESKTIQWNQSFLEDTNPARNDWFHWIVLDSFTW